MGAIHPFCTDDESIRDDTIFQGTVTNIDSDGSRRTIRSTWNDKEKRYDYCMKQDSVWEDFCFIHFFKYEEFYFADVEYSIRQDDESSLYCPRLHVPCPVGVLGDGLWINWEAVKFEKIPGDPDSNEAKNFAQKYSVIYGIKPGDGDVASSVQFILITDPTEKIRSLLPTIYDESGAGFEKISPTLKYSAMAKGIASPKARESFLIYFLTKQLEELKDSNGVPFGSQRMVEQVESVCSDDATWRGLSTEGTRKAKRLYRQIILLAPEESVEDANEGPEAELAPVL